MHLGETVYKCDICGKESKLKAIHEKHLETHSDEKKFTCDMCAKGFRTMISLKRHLFKEHKVEFSEKEKAAITKKPDRKLKPVDPECLRCNAGNHRMGEVIQ